MRTTDEIFRDAQIFADFSNLRTAEEAEYFRQNHSDFLPSVWWEWYAPLLGDKKRRLWQEMQRNLQEAWVAGFPLEPSVRLISSGAVPDVPLTLGKFEDENAVPNYIAPNAVIVPSAFVIDLESDLWTKATKVWPYQKVVMFLVVEPWRARFCFCGKRYVADKPARRFCSDKCFQDSRKLAKRVWWEEHGEKWREGKQKQVKKRKGKK